MHVLITETDRDTFLVNGKEVYQDQNRNWIYNGPDRVWPEELQALNNHVQSKSAEHFEKALQSNIVTEVLDERKRQDKKFGTDRKHHPTEWLMILGEEVGEANKAALETYFDHDSNDYSEYRKELIQVAAVAIAMVESHDRLQALKQK